jgi:hypothetical protein
VELAFLIDKSRWGEGLATEAALGIVRYARERLGVDRLICLITPGNGRLSLQDGNEGRHGPSSVRYTDGVWLSATSTGMSRVDNGAATEERDEED